MRASLCAAGLTVAALLGGAPVSAQAAGADEMRTELTAELEKYVTAFSEGRVAFIADSVYTAPAYFHGGGRVDVRMTRDDVRRRFEDMWAPLPAQGYDRSEIRGSDVCALNASAALVTLDFARLRRDGSVITEGTAVYLYARTEQGWRVTASLGSGPSVDCDTQAALEPSVVHVAGVQWGPPGSTPCYPQGVQTAQLGTDPENGGPAYFARFPAGSQFELHWHTHAEYVVVLSGSGAIVLDDRRHELSAGSYVVIPGRATHSWHVPGGGPPLVIQVRRSGPADFHFVDCEPG